MSDITAPTVVQIRSCSYVRLIDLTMDQEIREDIYFAGSCFPGNGISLVKASEVANVIEDLDTGREPVPARIDFVKRVRDLGDVWIDIEEHQDEKASG